MTLKVSPDADWTSSPSMKWPNTPWPRNVRARGVRGECSSGSWAMVAVVIGDGPSRKAGEFGTQGGDCSRPGPEQVQVLSNTRRMLRRAWAYVAATCVRGVISPLRVSAAFLHPGFLVPSIYYN